MNKSILAWATPPSLATLVQCLTQPAPPAHLVLCSPACRLPTMVEQENHHAGEVALWSAPAHDDTVARRVFDALACATIDAVHCVPNVWGETTLWWLPAPHCAHLATHFSDEIQWQTPPVPQKPLPARKIWQLPPTSTFLTRNVDSSVPDVVIIGAGIAGAATAYECAQRGARVTVLEAADAVAQAASGNRQGLLYAKISPHGTVQSELLLSGYGYTRHLLAQMLPDDDSWQACGVLHLNHNASETARNRQLGQHAHHAHLYRAVDAQQATDLAGIPITESALFWPQGAWLNPAALVACLLAHERIVLHTQQTVQAAHHDGERWHIQTAQGETFTASHIVFCAGAGSLHAPITREFAWQIIRGQTSVVRASAGSLQLKVALSGASYISPAWQNMHCFGATFLPNDVDTAWRATDEQQNRMELAQLNAFLAQEFAVPWHDDGAGSLHDWRGHAALRCDAYDHLPAVGALGDAVAMRQVYAKYAHDKNYRIKTPCPYLPNAYINTAHGSRGLATAPVCAADIAAQICGTPRLLSERLQLALNPNRLIINEIVHGKKGVHHM